MAVAVKSSPETSHVSLLDRLPVAVLAGVVYVLGSLAVVFKGIPTVWWAFWQDFLHLSANFYVGMALLALCMLAGAAGLFILGARLVGPHPVRGLRPGIVVGIACALVIGLLARWVGFLLEGWIYDSRLLGNEGWMLGAALTVLLAVVLLVLVVRLFFRAGFEIWLGQLEDQGWFSTTTFKRNQGQRVRRGTIMGLLVLAVSGIWTLVERKSLETGPPNWEVTLPYTGEAIVTRDSLGDFGRVKKLEVVKKDGQETEQAVADPSLLDKLVAESKWHKDTDTTDLSPKGDWTLAFSRSKFRDVNEQFRKDYVRVEDNITPPFKKGDVVARTDLDKAFQGITPQPETPSETQEPDGLSGKVAYQSMTLLPSVRYTLPLLLAALSIWLAWRVVNLPAFADFLIATEAELNKVSWTTRRHLVQDTIVVLVTVLLLSIFLLASDLAWINLLKVVGVVKERPATQSNSNQELPW